MSKSKYARDDSHVMTRPREQTPSLGIGMMLGAALTGVAITIPLTFMTWNQTRSLDQRFAAVENRLAQISTKVDQVGSRAAAPAQRGPDPNKVYTVRTDGAPFKGPKDAPITIAEFSEFQ
jgi:hypothetical protein